jgi:hypothetical protein
MMTLSGSWNRSAVRGLAVVGITLIAAAPLAGQTQQGSA